MAVFISVSTNAFEETFEDTRSEGRPTGQLSGVRRPLRGIEIKSDTYAVLKILTSKNVELPLVSSSSKNESGLVTEYSNFIVQQIVEQRAEKHQIVETFGEDYVFFFGERPRMLQVNGILVNTNDFNWKSEFWHNYENHLRGTKLAEANARLYMFFDDVVVEGYMIQAEATGTSTNPYHLPFAFQLFITNYAILSQVGDVFIRERAGATTFDTAAEIPLLDQTLSTGTSGLAGRAGAGNGGLISFLSSPVGTLTNTADFAIAQTLENIRNAFFGINVPSGIGSQIRPPLIHNRASFASSGQRNLPIYRNYDEYPEDRGPAPVFDNAEIARQNRELALNSGAELEREARRQLEALGISTTKRSAAVLLLGKSALAAGNLVGSFGTVRVDLSEVDI